MEILGVDFSGARSDKNTWVAQGRLDGQELVLESCRPVSRSQLSCLLEALPSGAVASLDFPFSVPLDFARFWRPEARAMPELWSAAADMNLEEFMSLRDAYVARRGETKRLCDSYHSECYSCLHKVNPNMVPMTFYGMKMLAQLWPAGCDVPPLPSQDLGKGVLLEAMPGAALKALNREKAPCVRCGGICFWRRRVRERGGCGSRLRCRRHFRERRSGRWHWSLRERGTWRSTPC